ncbi:hypothetical protein FRC03_000115 [Tulasnella sp. 419]|nr:hypothetical protein FRC03_000115 [Tulasnella sp. 419]
MVKVVKYPISRLPLPPSTQILTHNLTPEPEIPSAAALVKLLNTNPVSLRRSKPSDGKAHFSYLTPLPLPFPYRLPPPQEGTPISTVEERTAYINKALTAREALHQVSVPSLNGAHASNGTSTSPAQLKMQRYKSLEREHYERELLAIAPTGLRDCLPHLDIGDALSITGLHSASASLEAQASESSHESATAIRQELIDVLSGDVTLMSINDDDDSSSRGYAPWSLRYSGHQFGSWAGQLGDGRAISILETPHPDDPDITYEIQLKGAGRTPFSRTADGLAVLRSSIREFLGAEAVQALKIPTTRSLSLISLPTLPVAREVPETAAIVARLAPSFIRIGNFEALNPPERDTTFIFFQGGGVQAQQDPDYNALRILGEWVVKRVLKLELADGEPWGKKLVWECARRNAIMVAGWQQMGFMHGVMNTDNISIMGLTIDYGPYAFMDVFSDAHICNHTDETGRYAYKYQPTMIIYALRALLRSLSPLIGAEMELKRAVNEDWAAGASKPQIAAWSDEALEAYQEELEDYIIGVFSEEYWNLMRKRLGLKSSAPMDNKELIRPLLNLLETHRLDYHSTLRSLATFRPSFLNSDEKLEPFLSSLLSSQEVSQSPLLPSKEEGAKAWLEYLQKLAARVELPEEKEAWMVEISGAEDWLEVREKETKLHNPRFVLRQWVLEEVIANLAAEAQQKKAETEEYGASSSTPSAGLVQSPIRPSSSKDGKKLLLKVLDMATRPFEPWGAEGKDDCALTEEEMEERRLCGLGESKLLGFQCSCSS